MNGGNTFDASRPSWAITEDAVQITLEEAAILQSFRPDYPFQGTKTKRFEQVGNAVPPVLARHILAALIGVEALPAHEEDQ